MIKGVSCKRTSKGVPAKKPFKLDEGSIQCLYRTVASLIDTNFINKGNIILLSRSGAKSQGNKPRWPGWPTAAIYIGD